MTVETPITHQDAGTEATPADESMAAPRQSTNQFLFAILSFALGFGAAMLFVQFSSQNAQAIYQQALDDAVAAFVDALPNTSALAQDGPGQARNAPTAGQRFEASPDDDPYLGPEDAPVVIIEFSDFRCPYCGRFATTTLEPLLERYGDQIRFVYRDFPILGNLSFQAALAAECADDQDAFWPYHDLLFENQQSLSAETFLAFAEQLELDTEAFQSCLDDETYREEVLADFTAARQLGANGTPAFFINGRFVSGAQPLPVFEGIIDEELAALEADG